MSWFVAKIGEVSDTLGTFANLMPIRETTGVSFPRNGLALVTIQASPTSTRHNPVGNRMKCFPIATIVKRLKANFARYKLAVPVSKCRNIDAVQNHVVCHISNNGYKQFCHSWK